MPKIKKIDCQDLNGSIANNKRGILPKNKSARLKRQFKKRYPQKKYKDKKDVLKLNEFI